jgi:CDP-diacylglycerol--glycerol-3-phosphate 3-phosphatidyltransferase
MTSEKLLSSLLGSERAVPGALDVAPPIAVALATVALLLGYALFFRARPEPHFARLDHVTPSYLLTRRVMQVGYFAVSSIAERLARAGIRANTVTWTGLGITVLAALALASGHFGLGGFLLLVGAACDALDGAVARLEKKLGRAGATLDSIVDRWVEGLTIAGIVFAFRDAPIAVALGFLALFGSFMVSYGSARAEAAGVSLEGGRMRRGERAAWFALGCLLEPIAAVAAHGFALDPRLGRLLTVGALAVVAVGATLSSLSRSNRLIFALQARQSDVGASRDGDRISVTPRRRSVSQSGARVSSANDARQTRFARPHT